MRIAFIGNFSVPYTTENHHLWTYRKLGHKVITFQEDKTNTKEIIENLFDVDLLVHTHTHGWNIANIEQVYKICKEKGIPTVGYHLDLWKGIKREFDLKNDPYWNIEYFFTVDPSFIPDLESRGIKAYFLPAGVVENECYLAEPNREKYPHDVIFVGSKNYHPEWSYRPKLIEWLHKTYGSRFGHYGGDGLGVKRGKDLNELYASAKVVVGDTLCKGFEYPGYSSDRYWESLGRGAFLIYPRIKEMPTCCIEGEDVKYYDYNNFTQLKSLIDYYIDNETERKRIQLSGHAKIKRYETYTQRLQQLLKVVFG
jgi:hypothetical protein